MKIGNGYHVNKWKIYIKMGIYFMDLKIWLKMHLMVVVKKCIRDLLSLFEKKINGLKLIF